MIPAFSNKMSSAIRKIVPITLTIALSLSCTDLISDKAYGKYGQCQATTKKGKRCKSNAGKTGYCGRHK